jgi:hypothetical protein
MYLTLHGAEASSAANMLNLDLTYALLQFSVLAGKPPYYDLPQMTALYKIVQVVLTLSLLYSSDRNKRKLHISTVTVSTKSCTLVKASAATAAVVSTSILLASIATRMHMSYVP